MEDRVLQFQTFALRPKDSRTRKDIEKLRQFLQKNQEYRFTERDQSHLFCAIQTYYSAFQYDNDEDNPVLPLLEDALKMPFTVFTTNQKKSFLKWLSKVTDSSKSPKCTSNCIDSEAKFQVIEVDGNLITVMNEGGDTIDMDSSALDPEIFKIISRRFHDGEEVYVGINLENPHSIKRLVD
uniref:Translation elongation factor IF5A C-terminal domain-containing protein n=1 Tax=Polytomella parva TaxID=51329 RepID=A0A7S0YMH1_9CHLO